MGLGFGPRHAQLIGDFSCLVRRDSRDRSTANEISVETKVLEENSNWKIRRGRVWRKGKATAPR